MMRSPFDHLRRRGDPSEGTPLPSATSQNWLATGTFAVAGVLALLTVPTFTVLSLFGGAYGGALAVTAWLVRPRPKRRWIFGLAMAPVLGQAAIYVLFWYPIAAAAMTAAGAGTDPATADLVQSAVGRVAIAALLTGWAPALFLFLYARQARLLLGVQVIAPAGALIVWMLYHLLP